MFKFRTLSVAMFAALLALPVAAHAQAGAGKDKDKAAAHAAKDETKMIAKATARCIDNSWSMAASQKGACSSHGGVATWYKKPKDRT